MPRRRRFVYLADNCEISRVRHDYHGNIFQLWVVVDERQKFQPVDERHIQADEHQIRAAVLQKPHAFRRALSRDYFAGETIFERLAFLAQVKDIVVDEQNAEGTFWLSLSFGGDGGRSVFFAADQFVDTPDQIFRGAGF